MPDEVAAVKRHGRVSIYTADGYSDTQTIHLDTGDVSAQTGFMLVDVSDTTNWKHTNTDHVIIRQAILQIDPDTNFRGEIKIGFLSAVDGTNGDFNVIFDLDMEQKSDLLLLDLGFSGGFHCQSSTHFGPKDANSTLFQTDVSLAGPDGATSYPSGDGDLCMLVERSAGTVHASITIIYETVGS